eukprot:349824-Chlamydomonas_euryale.AAC.14
MELSSREQSHRNQATAHAKHTCANHISCIVTRPPIQQNAAAWNTAEVRRRHDAGWVHGVLMLKVRTELAGVP